MRPPRNPDCAPGDWYVDTACIDCGASRHVAPRLVVEQNRKSVFARWPTTSEEHLAAWRARLVYPTASVRSETRRMRPQQTIFPQSKTRDVWRCGFNARSSFGAHVWIHKDDRAAAPYAALHGRARLHFSLPSQVKGLMKAHVVGVLLALSIAGPASAAIKETPVTYSDGETTMKGFVVYDTAKTGKRPGIVMVHEWWGITKHMHNEARRFAGQGYVAFIADMFGDARTADNPTDAGEMSGSVMKNPKAMEARFNAAREQLAKQPTVDPTRIGAVGYCFGGAVVLNMARAGADLDGVVGFHASLGLNTPAPAPGTVKAKILVLNGADDPFVNKEQYATLKADMDAAKADYRVVEYPGAVHAFTNPEATALGKKFNLPLRYDAKVNKEAEAEATEFFAGVFKR
jgi:dienelactone hydrolase